MSDASMLPSSYNLSGLLHRLVYVIFLCFVLLIVAGCSDNIEQEKSPLHALSNAKGEFELPSSTNEITFPLAHMPKKSYQQEWWYITANLTTESGQKLASQWTLFRRAVEQKHWYFAHAALADSKKHATAYRTGREELGLVDIHGTPFKARIDDWQWLSTSTLLPATLSYGTGLGLLHAPKLTSIELNHSKHMSHEQMLEIKGEQWQVELNLSGASNFYLQGEQGFSQKHHHLPIASHYYSQPFIEVKGRVFWQGKWQKVTGDAWLDREWGSQMLALDQQGWDWFSLRLDEHTALMVYQIRSHEKDYLYGSIMNKNGAIRPLKADDIHVKELTSSINEQYKYPQAFNIQLPNESININVKVVNNQQIMRFGIEYFEGMVTFTGSHQGEGFLEMTGYQ